MRIDYFVVDIPMNTAPNRSNKVGRFFLTARRAFNVLQGNDPLRMAGATAFFTTFALPPIMIILFQLFSLFLSKRSVGSEIMEVLTSTLGTEGANQLRQTTRGLRTLAQTWWLAILGFIFLLFIATTLFMVIRNTINDIWEIRLKKRRSFLFTLKVRMQSALFIVVTGVLFVIFVGIEAAQAVAGDYIAELSDTAGFVFRLVFSQVTAILVVTGWFIILFRFIADARPPWRVVIAGGMLTGILFFAGKSGLSVLLREGNVATVYGASGAIVLVLLFVFYSSFILYYGASFIKAYADMRKLSLQPGSRATTYRLTDA